MSDSESFPTRAQSASSKPSQISHTSGMQWLVALSRMSRLKEDRHAAQEIICRLAESEYRVNELRRAAR